MSNEFIDTSQECIKEMSKLSKQALRKGCKVVTEIMQDDISSKHKHTGNLAKSVNATALIDKSTGQPKANMGYYSRSKMKKKYGIKYFVNPSWFEFGTRPHIIETNQLRKGEQTTYMLHDDKQSYGYKVYHPGLKSTNLLRNTVYGNTDKIVEQEEKYLSKLTDMMVEKGANLSIDDEETEDDKEDD